ncbi:MAG TPA: ribosome maturation factor RimP [Propioniciclava sp.]|uniref:ribosome maturation factor RimP n=1 Tax=Propioniciclava sp. TaxID=2038686 RepID=UPI002C0E4D9F|nr:ribosome maturation factor RimP [Propioniciclava sp.]HRL48764.1 ribosome maturation factor RimP [Propioniciclava sp.]
MNEHAIASLVEPLLAVGGLELDRLEIVRAGKRSVLRLYLDGDGPEGRGPSLDEIADATRAISVALDESPAVGNAPYTLEVSSRGVSRPLTELKHFRRNVGRLVTLTLPEGSLAGRIVAVDGDAVELDVDGVSRLVLVADIITAVVTAELRKDVPGDDDADEEE